MSKDNVKNFAKVTVSTTYDAAATSIVLSGGNGAKLPNPSAGSVPGTGAGTAFNLVWWDSTTYPDPSDDPKVEIVRCTARSTDTLTVIRAQESTTASTKNTAVVVYLMILAPTEKTIRDLASTVSGTFVDGDLSTGILTVTHNKVLSTPYAITIRIFDNNAKEIIPDSVTGLTNTATIDLTSYGTLTGTWGYSVI